ncbi:MAG: tryptophan-rich sensory protein [Candidatus Acidiferrales bacterium]
MSNWVWAAGACLAAIILETICAGREPAAALKALRQPPWALPFPAWVAIGFVYYLACFVAWVRLLGLAMAEVCLALLILLMGANAIWTYFFFRRRDFRLSFWVQIPYAALAIGFLGCAMFLDAVVASLFAVYVLYLPYAAAWTYRVWKLNGDVMREV